MHFTGDSCQELQDRASLLELPTENQLLGTTSHSPTCLEFLVLWELEMPWQKGGSMEKHRFHEINRKWFETVARPCTLNLSFFIWKIKYLPYVQFWRMKSSISNMLPSPFSSGFFQPTECVQNEKLNQWRLLGFAKKRERIVNLGPHNLFSGRKNCG